MEEAVPARDFWVLLVVGRSQPMKPHNLKECIPHSSMNVDAELTEFQKNKELINRLISIQETPFKLPQRFWNIRKQEANSVPQSIVETAISNLNLGIKSRTQKAYPPLAVRKFLESVEYQRIQQSRSKQVKGNNIQPYDAYDPIAYAYKNWLACCPSKWQTDNPDLDTAKRRRYAEYRRVIEKKIQRYMASKKKLEHYTKTCNDISNIDIRSIETIDRDSEVLDELHRTRELITRLKHNLQRASFNRLIDTDTATKEIPSIDKITKGLLWQ